jgi:hypothetical protein
LKADPEIADDIKNYMVALIDFPLVPTQQNESHHRSDRLHIATSVPISGDLASILA